ncbi:MAG TPA: hypothetical protein VIT88_02080, partial [Pyrinomonadaceae bacterium]
FRKIHRLLTNFPRVIAEDALNIGARDTAPSVEKLEDGGQTTWGLRLRVRIELFLNPPLQAATRN